MRTRIRRSSVVLATVGACALAGGGIATAATTHHQRVHHATSAAAPGSSSETVLTGATLTSASDAAIAAVPGGTVDRASTENPSDASGAAYEVHVTKSDASKVEVLEDSAFKVLSVKAWTGGGPGGPGGGPRGAGGGPGGGSPNEAVLTGATLTSASDAAIAAVPGGTVTRASAEDKADASGAAYEVHVTKTDGSQVEVLEDSAFKALSVNASTGHGPGPGH